jgi:2'-5' RNA ligase
MVKLSFPLQRVFIALPLEGEAKQVFQALQKQLSGYEKLFRFQNPESPHLTLYYFGEVMEIEYQDIIKRLDKIAGRTAQFIIKAEGIDSFDDRVLHLTIARSQELSTLKKLCPWPNVRPFAPHITLARMKNPNAFRVQKKKVMKFLKDIKFDIPVDRLRLYAQLEGMKQATLEDYIF